MARREASRDLLLVLVERLVARLFPEERQVAGHRDQRCPIDWPLDR